MHIETCRIGDRGALDISIKSAQSFMGCELAPTWELVGGHKHFTGQSGWCARFRPISNEEYTEKYLELLRQRYSKNKDRWHRFLREHETETVRLACYCADGKFCHRHIAAEVLTKVALSIGIKVR